MRAIGGVALALTASLVISACDGDDDSIESFLIEATESGGATAFQAPASVSAGVTRIELVNSGEEAHDAQLIRAEGDRTPSDVFAALRGSQGGLPDWLFLAGGPDTAAPGSTRSVVQELEPGTYFAVDTESFDESSTTEFEVTGEADDGLPGTDATISAFEYGFEAEGLEAGTNEVLFENTGAQPHHMRAAPLRPGATLEDVRQFVETEEGRPPVDLRRDISTTVLEGGTSQVVELELEAGEYAMLCFTADRDGGPPHVAQGMIATATVAG